MDSLDILKGATRRGLFTSELLVVVGGIAGIELVPAVHGVEALAIAILVGAYCVARAIVKAATAKALLQDVEPPMRAVEHRDIRGLE